MNKMFKNDKGFSAVEVILIAAAAALVVGVGYLVYENHFKTTTPVNKVATNAYAPGKSIQRPTATNEVIKLPELGIELVNVPPSIIDLTYYEYASGITRDTSEKYIALQFSTASLTKLDHNCAASRDAIGLLDRDEGTYSSDRVPLLVRQFNGFYISYEHNQDYCSIDSIEGSKSLLESQSAIFESFVMNPANIQLIQ